MHRQRRVPSYVFARLGDRRGRESEERFVSALGPPYVFPEWINGLRVSSRQEDSKGVDMVVSTNIGNIYIQIKSSAFGKAKFLKRRRSRRIAVVIVSVSDNTEALQRKFESAIEAERTAILSFRGGLPEAD